ncbi:MAG: patatin-like phospholipase family protein [Gemmatimonadaceae bacterium]
MRADHSDRLAALPHRTPDYGELALVLTGGGARGAYQVGVLRHLAARFPELRIPILTGVSAGGVNVAHLANHRGSFPEAVDELVALWRGLTTDHVFRVDASSLLRNAARWGARLVSGGAGTGVGTTRGLLDTSPLHAYLERALRPERGQLTGIDYNLHRGVLRAVAIGTTSFTTGLSVIWVQGRAIELWERPKRRSVQTWLGLDQVMASAALPLLFPLVQIGTEWHGDGGVRLAAPLSPALHLGAHKIITVATRYERTAQEADMPDVVGYPPPAQVLGVLYNAIFLDLIDQDVIRLARMNKVLRAVPEEKRDGLRIVDILVVRPSRDLGRIAKEYEPRLPRAFRFLTRGTGTRETASPDFLSLLMFQDDYIGRLIELGEADAAARSDEIAAFLGGTGAREAVG